MSGVVADRVVVELEARLDRYNANVNAATRTFQRGTAQMRQDAVAAERQISRSFANIRSALLSSTGLIAGGVGLAGLKNLLDGYTRYTNQLKVAGLEGSNLTAVQDRLFATAQRYGVELESLGQLYGRIAQGSKELGASQSDLLQFTNGVAAAIKIQGGSATDARGALLQLSQALGGEIVRAEEFNSINEGARPILQAVANGIDKYAGSVAKLRRDVIDGNVSSKDFFNAFLKGSAQLEEQATRANFTIGQSFTILNNALGKYMGETDQALSLTARLGTGIAALANNLDTIVPALAAIAVAFGALKIGSLLFGAATTAAASYLEMDRAVAAQILAGNASYVSRTQLQAASATAAAASAAAELAAIEGVIAARTAEGVALAEQIAAERALIAARTAEATSAAVAITQGAPLTATRRAQTIAENDAAFASDRLAAARTRQNIVNAELVAAEAALAAAQARSTAAAVAEAEAVTAATAAKRAGAATTALFSGVLTTLGAAIPFVAIAAFTAAVIYAYQEMNTASFSAKQFAEEGEDLATNLHLVDTYARGAASAISQVGNQAAASTNQVRAFAGAVGEAAQKLYDLARARRRELFVSLATDEIKARNQRLAADERLRQSGGTGTLPITGGAREEFDRKTRKERDEAAERERRAQAGIAAAIKIPLPNYLKGSEREGGRDIEGQLARVTRDLTVARERGIRSQIDTLEAQKFELTQYKKYRKQGLSPEAAGAAASDDASKFRNASAGAASDRAARAGHRKKKGPSAETLARREAAAERDEAGDAARYAAAERRVNNEIAAAKAELSGSAKERAAIEKARIEDERLNRAEELRQQERQGQLGKGEEGRTRLLELQRLNDERARLETEVVDRNERVRIAREATEAQLAGLDNERDLLEAQESLATTTKERRDIALRILANEFEREKLGLEAIIASEQATEAEKKIAQARLNILADLLPSRVEQVNRETEGVGANYLRQLNTATADINEQLDQVAVNGLRNMEDQLTSTISKVFELGGAFGKIANSIIADLVRIAIQRAIIQPLADLFFGMGDAASGFGGMGGGGLMPGAQSQGGGWLSFLKGGLSAASMLFGGGGGGSMGALSGGGAAIGMASGGHVAAGRLVEINEYGTEGWQPSQSGKVIPLGRMNSAMAPAAAGEPALVRVIIGASPYFEPTVRAISGNVAVETVREAAPGLVDLSVSETFRRAERPEM